MMTDLLISDKIILVAISLAGIYCLYLLYKSAKELRAGIKALKNLKQ